MQGSFCRFYVHESDLHDGRPLLELLLDEANRLAIRGGSAFKAIAGFGRRHVLHECQFFELAGSLTVEVEFIVSEDEAQQLLDLLRSERIRVFYALVPARFGMIGPDKGESR